MNEQAVEDRVRDGLATLAGPPAGREQAWQALQRARAEVERGRRRTTGWFAVAAVAAVVVIVAGAAQFLVPSGVPTTAPTAAGAITSWPARGDLVGDAAVVDQAEQVWRAEAPAGLGPAQQVSTLFAGEPRYSHATVVMLLSQVDGHTLVGIVSSLENLSGPTQPARHLVLRAVATVNPRMAIRSVGFVTSATAADHPSMQMTASLGYVLLAPGIDAGQVRSSMVDGFMSDTDELPPSADGLVRFDGFAGSGPWNSWVVVPKGAAGADVVTGDIGSPGYVPGHVDSTGAVRADNGTALHTGDLVVARDDVPAGNGLLGVVTSVGSTDAEAGQIDPTLTNLDRWGLHAVSVGSNYRGTLSRSGNGGLVFTTDNPQAPNGVSRVVVQTADGTVTVNVGSFAPPAPGTPNTTSPFPLRQSDTLPHTGSMPVWIIATGA